MAYVNFTKHHMENYVNECYSNENYLKPYEFELYINGYNMWLIFLRNPIKP